MNPSLPADETEKQRWRDQRKLVREILWAFWDPIGVAAIEGAPKDEYDQYVGGVVAKLRDSQTAKQIAQYLYQTETEHIGMRGDRARATSVARMLKSLNIGA